MSGRGRGGRGRGGRTGATPDIHNPSLPPVRTSQSFGYGADQTPNLPRQFNANPDMSVADMAKDITGTPRRDASTEYEQIIASAQATPHRGRTTRSQRDLSIVPEDMAVPPTPKPNIRPKQQKPKQDTTRGRQKTPDQEQLERELRRASGEAERASRPLVQQQNGSVIPSLMGPPPRPTTSSSGFETGTDVSWVTERKAVPDSQPRPTKKTPAKPLSVPRQTTPANIGANITRPQPESVPAPIPPAGESPISWVFSDSPSGNEAAPKAPPTRTSAYAPRREPPIRRIEDNPLKSKTLMVSIFLIAAILSVMAMLGGICALGGSPKGVLPFKLPPALCHVPGAGYFGDKSDCEDAIDDLSGEINQKLYDMQYEFSVAKEELERRIAEINRAEPVEAQSLSHKVNFFSFGVGSHIIPSLTTPPKKIEHEHFFRRLKKRMVGTPQQKFHQTSPHVALLPWEDIGECWCAEGSHIQLGVSIGHKLIPEEIVIEHIHRDATMGPLLAPRGMELWAEYVPKDEPDSGAPEVPVVASMSAEYHQATATPTSYSYGVKLMSPHYRQTGSSPLSTSARMYLLDTLRMTYKNEPDDAFSDDPYLGPTFFRIGKWEYDIYNDQTSQRFPLDVSAEMPGYRVKNTVVRVTSNWGGDATCIYRVRLHGTPLHVWN